MPIGTYSVVETGAPLTGTYDASPVGYQRDNTVRTIVFDGSNWAWSNWETISGTRVVKNWKQPMLPTTGNGGTAMMAGLGSVVFVVGSMFAAWYINERRMTKRVA